MPLDPFCIRSANLKRVQKEDPDLGMLVRYAKGIGARLWRGEDNKLFLTHPQWGDIPQTSTLAGDTLDQAAARTMQSIRAFKKAQKSKARMTRRIRNAEKTVAAELNQTPPLSANEIYGTAALFLDEKPAITEITRYTTGFRVLQSLGGSKALLPLESSLSRMGQAGNELANLFRQANELEAAIKGKAATRADKLLKMLTKEEDEGLFNRYVEHGEYQSIERKQVMEHVRVGLTQVMDEYYDAMQRLGADVRPKVGAGATNPTGNYWPHVFDMVALREKRITREVIDQVVEAHARQGKTISRDQALDVIASANLTDNRTMTIKRIMRESERHSETPLTFVEAEHILDSFISKNGERLAGNIEKDRLGVRGYSTNARETYVAAINRNSRRLAELAVFGKKDVKVHNLLDTIRNTNGKHYEVAKKAYWMEIGKEGAHLQGLAREVYDWQAAKLSLAVIANMSQSINTVMRIGLRPFVMAARDAIALKAQGKGLVREAVEASGAMPKRMFQGDSALTMVHDMLSEYSERGLAQVLDHDSAILRGARGIRKGLTSFSLSLFENVEIMNRFLAQRGGEYYFDALAKGLKGEKGLTSELLARAKELGFRAEAIRAAQSEELAFMRQMAGARISNYSQFRGGIQQLPLYAHDSAMGKFAYQFKTFALNQARFVSRELTGPHGDPARRARALAAILVAYPAAGLLIGATRRKLMGETALSSQIDQWWDEMMADPISLSTLALAAAAFVQAGSLGIISDIVWSAAQGNRFNLTNMFIPPAASTVVNFVDATGAAASMGTGLLTGEDVEDDWNRLTKGGLRELGGFGAGIQNIREEGFRGGYG